MVKTADATVKHQNNRRLKKVISFALAVAIVTTDVETKANIRVSQSFLSLFITMGQLLVVCSRLNA
jgi:flavin reductase (DIM6/NTAB) family NADH-FMN oxidoreductase RutF